MDTWKFFLNGGHLFAALAWLVALAWVYRVLTALVMLPRVPDLLRKEHAPQQDAGPWPWLTVIVPARDEAAAIGGSLRSLLASDYPHLEIIAVDDRSRDGTGEILDSLASSPLNRDRLRVLHVKELPEGWLGKPHAMAMAAREAKGDWLLFTDADVFFAPDTFRRAILYAERDHADHLVVYPTMILKGLWEHVLLAFFQGISVWAARAWKVADPRAKRDFIGVGAFNLIRRSVYRSLGGYEALRMEVLEDMHLGQRAKLAGHAQRVAFGRDLVRIRWADSAWGIMENLTKNMYAVFRFRSSLLLAACVGLMLLCLTPFVALAVPGAARWAGVATLVALLLLNLRYWPQTRIPPQYLLLFPISTLMFLFVLLRSMILTLRRGGVLWRGTLYPLAELRRQAGPLW